MQRQSFNFDNMEFSTLNWVKDSVLDDDFDDIFAIEYKSFLVDYEPEYDVFEFDNLCFTVDCLLTTISESASKSVFAPVVELKPLPDSSKYTFIGPAES